ncbi:MAG: PVC-type heme-binding CxxCH protein [Acidobacteriota bacterium]|nr:PVC-type heme-binding CxxCH protein [Acidobacteriota bacterium]
MRSLTICLTLLSTLAASALPGCLHRDDKGTSLDPDEFIATAGLPADLRLELAASEPAVVDPVGVTFDADGRMYVVEMGGYPTRPEGSPPLGRVKRLVDQDLDGFYETWTLFADGLQYPTSVLPWRDGVLVTQPPDILFLRDDDGDGVADTRELLFSGFPVGNTQHNINGLTRGLDNWVYAANGGNHGEGYALDAPDAVVSIRGTDFRFRPDTGELEPSFETTGGHGIAFDAWGRMFGTHNLNHIQHMVFPSAELSRNPHLSVPTTRDMISDHGSSAPLFQISDAETRVNHPEQSGRFSGGSGIAFYGGGALPPAYNDSLFVNDVVVNVVHQDVIEANGPSFTATRRAEGVELLAGRDNWFRPVTLSTGPDGALYVVDMHRAVIEHPEWIPDAVEATLDVRAGDDKGRIYRIVPRDGLTPVRPGLASADLPTLVGALAHPNKWWRDTAQRVLVERADPTAGPLVTQLLRSSDVALGRLHALWTLRGLEALGAEDLLAALSDPAPGVRENALILAQPDLGSSETLRRGVVNLADDPDARVRMQVALTLGHADTSETRDGLQTILARDAGQRWTRYAVLAGVDDGAANVLRALLDTEPGPPSDRTLAGVMDAIRHLAATSVADVDGELSPLVRLAGSPGLDTARRAALLDGLADGLVRREATPDLSAGAAASLAGLLTSTSTPVVRGALRVAAGVEVDELAARDRAIERARARALDPDLTPEVRLEEVALLGLATYEQVGETLLALMEPQVPPALQTAAARALVGLDAEARGAVAIDRWRRSGPEVKGILLDMLLRNRPFHALLVDALETGTLTVGELNLDLEQRRRLLRRSSDAIQRRAGALFGDHEFSNRQAVVEQWLPDVLARRGNADRGAAHFQTLCAQCHFFRGVGYPVGPDLGMAFTKGEEDLLTSILDPSAALAPEYANYLLETADGELLNGIISAETASGITLARANGETDTVLRSQIDEIRTEGRSLMPDGLEQGLDAGGLADLLAYLRQHSH